MDCGSGHHNHVDCTPVIVSPQPPLIVGIDNDHETADPCPVCTAIFFVFCVCVAVVPILVVVFLT